MSDIVANIIAAKDETWDAIVLVEYPRKETFKEMAYRDLAEPLRLAALEDIKLFMTRIINNQSLF